MKTQLNLGQKLFAKICGRNKKVINEEWMTVTKIGRKYFTVTTQSGLENEFDLVNWRRRGENVHSNSPIYLYPSEEHACKEEKVIVIAKTISEKMKWVSDWEKLELGELEAIAKILLK